MFQTLLYCTTLPSCEAVTPIIFYWLNPTLHSNLSLLMCCGISVFILFAKVSIYLALSKNEDESLTLKAHVVPIFPTPAWVEPPEACRQSRKLNVFAGRPFDRPNIRNIRPQAPMSSTSPKTMKSYIIAIRPMDFMPKSKLVIVHVSHSLRVLRSNLVNSLSPVPVATW